jgi:uncharacterized coiled-coil DUF342 family protein
VEYRSDQIVEELNKLWMDEDYYRHEIQYMKTLPEDERIRAAIIALHKERRQIKKKILVLEGELNGLCALKCGSPYVSRSFPSRASSTPSLS